MTERERVMCVCVVVFLKREKERLADQQTTILLRRRVGRQHTVLAVAQY